MFTQYNKKLQCWEIYKLVQKGNKIKAYQLGAEQTKNQLSTKCTSCMTIFRILSMSEVLI